MSTKAKTFDCVEMKDQAASKIRERLKGMSVDEQIAYWKRRSEELRLEQEQLRRESLSGSDSGTGD